MKEKINQIRERNKNLHTYQLQSDIVLLFQEAINNNGEIKVLIPSYVIESNNNLNSCFAFYLTKIVKGQNFLFSEIKYDVTKDPDTKKLSYFDDVLIKKEKYNSNYILTLDFFRIMMIPKSIQDKESINDILNNFILKLEDQFIKFKNKIHLKLLRDKEVIEPKLLLKEDDDYSVLPLTGELKLLFEKNNVFSEWSSEIINKTKDVSDPPWFYFNYLAFLPREYIIFKK
tara:strand:- start:1508 stop:2194 length:687 start_codon:yes stop_codon:yes gene_type:complete